MHTHHHHAFWLYKIAIRTRTLRWNSVYAIHVHVHTHIYIYIDHYSWLFWDLGNKTILVIHIPSIVIIYTNIYFTYILIIMTNWKLINWVMCRKRKGNCCCTAWIFVTTKCQLDLFFPPAWRHLLWTRTCQLLWYMAHLSSFPTWIFSFYLKVWVWVHALRFIQNMNI